MGDPGWTRIIQTEPIVHENGAELVLRPGGDEAARRIAAQFRILSVRGGRVIVEGPDDMFVSKRESFDTAVFEDLAPLVEDALFVVERDGIETHVLEFRGGKLILQYFSPGPNADEVMFDRTGRAPWAHRALQRTIGSCQLCWGSVRFQSKDTAVVHIVEPPTTYADFAIVCDECHAIIEGKVALTEGALERFLVNVADDPWPRAGATLKRAYCRAFAPGTRNARPCITAIEAVDREVPPVTEIELDLRRAYDAERSGAAPSSGYARAIFTDWLEQNGRSWEAEFYRRWPDERRCPTCEEPDHGSRYCTQCERALG